MAAGKPGQSIATANAERRPAAIVTGASSGIGAELARRLHGRGFTLVLTARRVDRLEQLAANLGETADCEIRAADFSNPGEAARVIGEAAKARGGIDLLVNNAGYGACEEFLNLPEAERRNQMQVNYWSAVECIDAVLPGMLERGSGSVINIASISSKWGPWGHSAYAPAKAALVSLTQSLACEYSDRGVRFCYVNPGIVKTEFFDRPSYSKVAGEYLKRAISPALVAARIIDRLDNLPAEICVPRHYGLLDWVKAVSPGIAARLVGKNSRPAGR